MEANEQNMGLVRQFILASMSGANEERKHAESQLLSAETEAGFPIVILSLISALNSSDSQEDNAIRQSASIYFKNLVKRRWPIPDDERDDTSLQVLHAQDSEPVKNNLVELLCSSPPNVAKQLAESVAIIGEFEFPQKWPSLLPQLVSKLQEQDLNVVKGVMITANSIMKRFRFSRETDLLLQELKECLDGFQEPLLQTIQMLEPMLEQFKDNKDALDVIMETIRLTSRVFLSMCWMDLPEYFEDHLKEWMTIFVNMLNYKNDLLVDEDEDTEPDIISKVQAAIVENVNLYVLKYEEEFMDYLPAFTEAIWGLLVQVGDQPKYDVLATSSIKYLTSVSSKKMNNHLFSEQTLQEIIQNIVVKNLTATENDEELFEDNPQDYIRKDIEGSDQDTRRRCAVELVRSLLTFFAPPVSQMCLGYITDLLKQYEVSKNWRMKDAALNLLLAVAVTNASATELNEHVEITDLFNTQVLPEIQDPNDVDSRPIVKADAIKLICLFRQHLPAEFLVSILPHVITHLKSKAVVVQTYAAICIERFLFVKDQVVDSATGVVKKVPRITKDHLGPYLQTLMAELFAVLENPDLPENDYVMKCIMRVLVVLDQDIVPFTQLMLQKLTAIFEVVAKRPVNPHYNHYLFENFSLLIRNCCAGQDSAEGTTQVCDQFEAQLFPPFQQILSEDVTEFVPYVFQILALLQTFRPGNELSEAYQVLFPPILSPALWERRGNVPALTDLLYTYISRDVNFIVSASHLEAVLGVFQKLLSLKPFQVYAFRVLNGLFLHMSIDSLQTYLPEIFGMLLKCLQENIKGNRGGRNSGFIRQFVHTCCFFADVYGGGAICEVIDSVEQGLTKKLVMEVFGKQADVVKVATPTMRKRILVGGTKLLCEGPSVNGDPESFSSLFLMLVTLLNTPGLTGGSGNVSGGTLGSTDSQDYSNADEGAEDREFDSTYSKLVFAATPEPIMSTEMQDAPAFFAQSLGTLCQSNGAYAHAMQEELQGSGKESLMNAFQSLLTTTGVSI
jgi:exportin-2 (importin alpha re-exporter)